ncbi:MAG: hypothetical protein ACJ75T_07575 [Solirubrobacterales bacterium]
MRPADRWKIGFGWRELACVSALLTAFAFVVFGYYAFHGGFIADDWVNADRYYFHPDPGFWGAVDNYQTPSRPLAGIYVTLTYAVLGTHFDLHLLLALFLAAFLSIAYFTFLRTLGLGLPWALAAAAILLVFPSSDSTRLWSTGSQINLFIGLYLVAMVIAIAGRRRFGPAPSLAAVLTQIVASAIALVAVGGYEIVAPAVFLSFVLYRWVGGCGGTLWRWLLDVIPTVLLLLLYTRKFGETPAGGAQLLDNVHIVFDGAAAVLAYSLYPTRILSTPWPLVALVAGVLLVTQLVRQLAPPSPDRDAIARWSIPILLAVAGIAIGYAMIVPVGDRYMLYVPGVLNRTNCFAGLGFSALMVFLAATVGSIVAASLPRISAKTRAQARAGITAALILGVIGVYTVRITQDADRWIQASEIQGEILDQTQELVPSPPPDATIFTAPYPANAAPGVPAFGGGGNNDEVGAFKVTYDSEEMRAFPVIMEVGLTCGADEISQINAGNSETEYGKAILVDLRTRTVYRPKNQRQCIAARKAIEPFGLVNLRLDW